MSERLVQCRKLKQELPGLSRPPFRSELGQRLYEEISQQAWEEWKRDSVKFINTYRPDLATVEGQKFMFRQCAIYFGFEEGDAAQTAWTPPSDGGSHEP